MKSLICSVRDLKASAFMAPFVAPTKGFAVRMFSDEVYRDESLMSKHPADFVLYHVGFFEEESGTVWSCVHEILMDGERLISMRKEA